MTLEDRVSWIKRLSSAFNFGRTKGIKVDREVAEPPGPTLPATLGVRSGPATRGISLPRFHSTASDQLDRRVADEIGVARLKLRSAFTPAQPITDPWMFAGRTELLGRLIRAVEDQRLHAIVYGVRGIGKTSLLHVLATMAREARYQVTYVTCGASATFTEMFRAVAADIPLLYHSDFGPTSAEGEKGATLTNLIPSGDISPRTASELCAKVTGTRVLVVLDEFDRAQSPHFGKDVAEFIKNLSDRAVRVQLVVAGVAENLDGLMRSNGVVQRNVVAVQVPRMSADEVEQLVRNGQELSGVKFQAEAAEALGLASAGMPYLASLLSQQAALSALADTRMSVNAEDISNAIASTLSEVRGRLSKSARMVLEGRVRHGSSTALGAVASFAYLSGNGVSADNVSGMFPDQISAARAKSEIAELVTKGVLVDGDDGSDHSLRFKDENELLYLWLLTVRDGLGRSQLVHEDR